jgi:Flp pilus assembly protein protease CpaA
VLSDIANIVCLILLLIVAIQDIKSNEIYLVVLLALLPLGFFLKQTDWQTALLASLGIVFITFFIGFILRIKLKKETIALGDFLFLGFVGLRFNPTNALLIIILSSIIGIVISGIIMKKQSLPFAGYLAISSIFFLGLEFFKITINIYSLYA